MKHLARRTLLAASLLAAFAGPAAAQAAGAQWPLKPVRVIVGFAAGGPTDVMARAFAEYATRSLGQTFIVENRPGANTILAAEAVAGASPDGYTLLFAATNHTMIPALYSARVRFDAVKSFTPVCMLASSPTVLVVGPAMPVKSLSAFVEAARKQPGQRTYATPGTGSSGHFASEQFTRLAGITMNHIPYKGAAPAITDLMGGQVDSSFATLGSVLPQIQSGKLTALAVASPQRSSLMPQVPTFAESGFAGYSADAWYGILAPAGLPAGIEAALQRTATAFSADPATAATLARMGMERHTECGPRFGATLERETRAYGRLARELHLQAN
jgi:tripartite-type tricarboxylate transporter receptor subunit TctC